MLIQSFTTHTPGGMRNNPDWPMWQQSTALSMRWCNGMTSPPDLAAAAALSRIHLLLNLDVLSLKPKHNTASRSVNDDKLLLAQSFAAWMPAERHTSFPANHPNCQLPLGTMILPLYSKRPQNGSNPLLRTHAIRLLPIDCMVSVLLLCHPSPDIPDPVRRLVAGPLHPYRNNSSDSINSPPEPPAKPAYMVCCRVFRS
eukprot:GHUV01004641.1.p1 GENE.GHUV01004641.1~~GHUV01004641.1.p1  ORF type:complete len:199 (-),score=12.91 GHUV01004641.1:386-982(-)